MIASIDINADLGEHDGDGFAGDEALLDVVSSASIACGAHAGNADVMEHTARLAKARGVTIGAHPSYPDREGFGRRDLDVPLVELIASVRAQILLLEECCDRAGTSVRYIKPHGALYNRAVRDSELADALAECFRSIDPHLSVLTLPGSTLASASRTAGLRVAREAFIDRSYLSNGTLVPRSQDGAVIHDADEAAGRAVDIALRQSVAAIDGSAIGIDAQSLCVHGDSRNALSIVRLSRAALERAGLAIRPFA